MTPQIPNHVQSDAQLGTTGAQYAWRVTTGGLRSSSCSARLHSAHIADKRNFEALAHHPRAYVLFDASTELDAAADAAVAGGHAWNVLAPEQKVLEAIRAPATIGRSHTAHRVQLIYHGKAAARTYSNFPFVHSFADRQTICQPQQSVSTSVRLSARLRHALAVYGLLAAAQQLKLTY